MSGGSFNYLYGKAQVEILPCLRHHKEMCDALKKFGIEGSRARSDFLLLISAFEIGMMMHSRLQDVMHAIEWNVSGDYSADQVREVLEKYERDQSR